MVKIFWWKQIKKMGRKFVKQAEHGVEPNAP